MKEFKTALKEVLEAQTGAGKPLESVNLVKKSGNFVPEESHYNILYFEEPFDLHLSGNGDCRAIQSDLNIYCLVRSELNNREEHEGEVEELAWRVADVILDNPKLKCTSYPGGFCDRAFTKIGKISFMNGTANKNHLPVEVAVIPLTVRYEIRR